MTIMFREDNTGDNKKTLHIDLAGHLDIFSHEQFNSYKLYIDECNKVVINMSGLEHLDSSSLGLLLMLRERAGGTTANIEIINCSPSIFKIFTAVKFNLLFNITPQSHASQQ